MLYNNLSGYFRKRYGQRLKKICIDGGFSCPNRDGKCGTGGCIYCGERGAGEHIDELLSIGEQVRHALSAADESEGFVAYFQNFTNTYAPVEVLKERYDSALIDERIRVLAIGTRPDCITEENAKLIADYKSKLDVWVELGLQTSNERTAKIINRGYDNTVFEEAVKILKEYEIPYVVHMIIGLPGESEADAIESAKYINSFEPFGVKIHSIYVMEGTELARMYREKRYTPPTLSEYSVAAAKAIACFDESVIIHRITGDCPKDLLIAPEWNKDKSKIIDAINLSLSELNLKQGALCVTPQETSKTQQ